MKADTDPQKESKRKAAKRKRLATLNRARVAKHRKLVAEEKARYEIVIDGDVLDALVRWHWIADNEIINREKVAKAIADGLKEAALNDLKKVL